MSSRRPVVSGSGRSPLPFESLWSLLHNFCRTNLVGDEDVAESISAYDTIDRSRRNLREANWVDVAEVSEMLGLSAMQFSRSLHEHYVCDPKDGVYDILVSRSVRFCPCCIERGFHSPLHDLMYFKKCPVHFVPLVDKCPSCKKGLPFRMPTRGCEAYSCICGHQFVLDAGTKDIEAMACRLRLAEEWAFGIRSRVIHAVALFLKDRAKEPKGEDIQRLLAEYSPSSRWYADGA